MKKITMIFLLMLLTATSTFARPAYQGTARVQQPDGTFITIRLVGDEYRSFNTTDDGYTLTRDDRGYYVYACLDADGHLAPTEFVARDAAERDAADVAYLERVGKWLTPAMNERNATARRRNQVARQQTLAQRRAARYDYSQFHGLVILVEYSDCKFRYDDYASIMDEMINQDNYTGDSRTNVSSSISCTGSLRDYFRDNSSGVFLPTFDIVGPVKVNRSQYYARPNGNNGEENYAQLITDAINAADGIVNFKDYNVDGDSYVDMVYFIFAGLPSSISGNDERLLWPHQSDLSYRRLRKDGVYIGRYACSTELFGSKDWSVLDGIGTMTHEFSHVLGLPDLYDTNNSNPEECVNPGKWSVMAGGADGNYGRTPINYSLYERYSLGFATPEVIDEVGTFSMEAIHKSNMGYRLNTPVKKEFFLLENRQKSKWDSVLPGHGMLIFRVDSTNSAVWEYNTVNDNPNHPYYEVVRAKGVQSATTYEPFPASNRDPFPGVGRVTAINNETSPANLLTWAGKHNDFGLRNISEQNGIITFETYYANVLTEIELPDSITMGYATTTLLTPTLTPENAKATFTWTSDNEKVATVNNDGLVRAVSEGQATITITADNGVTASCHVTVKHLQTVDDIAAFRSLDEGSSAQLTLNDVQVLFVDGSDIYIRDSKGSLLLSDTDLKAHNGDILNGYIFGQLQHENRVPQLTPVENVTTTTNIIVTDSEEGAKPRQVKHNGSLNDDMLADLLTLKGVTMTLENKMVFAEVGNQKARMYNTFGLKNISTPKASALAGKYFDVTGILTTNVINDTIIYVISLTESVIQVEKPSDTIKGDVNGDGFVDVADISAIISIMAGEDTGFDSSNADVNGDGNIDVADISSVIDIMAGNVVAEALTLKDINLKTRFTL